MKLDYYLLVICIGLIVLITIPISIYIPGEKGMIMSFAVGVVLGGVFTKWGIQWYD